MNKYFLCLNASKTKILVIAPPSLQPKIIMRGVFIYNMCIRFMDLAKNLGVMLDSVLSFKTRVHMVVKSCYATIKYIPSIKKILSESHLKQLVCSCIFSLLDYCNAFYYGINSSLLTKLQRIQRRCAKLVTNRKTSGFSLMVYK